jgi:hypothetical protein
MPSIKSTIAEDRNPHIVVDTLLSRVTEEASNVGAQVDEAFERAREAGISDSSAAATEAAKAGVLARRHFRESSRMVASCSSR